LRTLGKLTCWVCGTNPPTLGVNHVVRLKLQGACGKWRNNDPLEPFFLLARDLTSFCSMNHKRQDPTVVNIVQGHLAHKKTPPLPGPA